MVDNVMSTISTVHTLSFRNISIRYTFYTILWHNQHRLDHFHYSHSLSADSSVSWATMANSLQRQQFCVLQLQCYLLHVPQLQAMAFINTAGAAASAVVGGQGTSSFLCHPSFSTWAAAGGDIACWWAVFMWLITASSVEGKDFRFVQVSFLIMNNITLNCFTVSLPLVPHHI